MTAPVAPRAFVTQEFSQFVRGRGLPFGAGVLVGLAVFALHVFNVGEPGLWYDETVTVSAASRGLPELYILVARIDAVHAVYYATLHLWLSVVEYSPFTLRLPSVFAVAVTSALLVRLGQLYWSMATGVFAGMIFGLLPRTLWMSTQGRSYAFSALLATVIVMAFLVAMREGDWWRWVVFAATLTLGAHTFLYVLLLVPGFALMMVVSGQTRVQRARWAASTIGAMATCVPLIVMAVSQRGQIAWTNLVTVPRAVLAPFYIYLDGVSTMAIALGWAVLIATGLVIAIAKRSTSRSLDHATVVALLLGWVAIPVLGLLLVGSRLHVYYDSYLSFTAPGLALAVAVGVTSVKNRVFTVTGLTVALLLAIQPWFFFRTPNSKTDMLDAVAMISPQVSLGDNVWFVPGSTWHPRQLAVGYPQAFSGMVDVGLDSDAASSATFFGTDKGSDRVVESVLQGRRVVAVVNGSTDDREELDVVLRSLGNHDFHVVRVERTGEWSVYVIERQAD